MKKAGSKKNFHLGSFAVKKVGKVGKLRIGGYAAGLPVWIPENPEPPEHLEPPENPRTQAPEPRTLNLAPRTQNHKGALQVLNARTLVLQIRSTRR